MSLADDEPRFEVVSEPEEDREDDADGGAQPAESVEEEPK